MADILGAGSMDMRVGDDTSVYVQEFAVPYRYQVCFTEGVFRADNRTLLQELTRLEPAKRHRYVVFLDEGVASAMPELRHQIVDYAAAWPNSLDMVAPPEIITGGEVIKNDPALVERLQHRMLELGMDRSQGSFQLFLCDDTGNADFGGADELDVDVVVCQNLEHPCRNTRSAGDS